MDWENWYQYESHTPNVNNPAAASLLLTNADGAYCDRPDQLTCFAPEWASVHYLNRQMGKHDFAGLRNEFFDDIKGQRTGFRTVYTEHTIGFGHWIGTTFLVRPELRFERSYDVRAYDNATKQNQFMFACDGIFFF